MRTGNPQMIAAALAAVVVLAAASSLPLVLTHGDTSPPGPPPLHATPATLDKVFAAAKGGETIMLDRGEYGTFRGGEKSSRVTLRARTRWAATMALDFDPAVNVRIVGMTLRDVRIAGRSRHVDVAGSNFTGPAVIKADQMVDAGIVLERNRHRNIDVCSGCFEGRVDVTGQAGAPAGITIRRSIFGPGGNADGVQTGGNGVRILDNEFVGIRESRQVHTDAIQLYGSRGTTVRGNWIHDTPTGIVAPDGADHEVIENNLIDPGSYPFAIAIGSDDGSVIRHNTLPGGACAWNLSCGIVSLGTKRHETPGRGTIVRDNVLGELSVKPGAVIADQRDNLVAPDRTSPAFVGGDAPHTWAGFRLEGNSPGKAVASDGTDLGIAAGPLGP
jgi:Right handed beta helix region